MKKKIISCFILLVLFAIQLQAQIITTIAGNGTFGTIGDGGPAIDAELARPWGVATDRHGNIYISFETDSRVRKISTSGIITTVAGTGIAGFSGDGGPATLAQFRDLREIRFDRYGNLYVTDVANSRVRKIDTFGIVSTVAGNGISGYSGDGVPATATAITPYGLEIDLSGNLYIGHAPRIRKVNTAGIISTIAGNGIFGYSGDGGPATLAALQNPYGITIDVFGNIFFADQNNRCVRKIDTSGVIVTFAGNGTTGYSGDGGDATAAQMRSPAGISLDSSGNVYIADFNTDCIRKVNTLGIITTYAGTGIRGFSGDGGLATAAQMSGVVGLAIDLRGRMYISDRLNNRVRMISAPNSTPYFTRGHTQNITVCTEFATVDSLLPVMDIDTGQVLTWSLVTPPAHGSAIASHTAITTGGVLIPSGSTYIPTFGYIGPDTFSVRVSDGLAADTTVICVSVIACPLFTTPLTGAAENNNLMFFPNPAKDALNVRYTTRSIQDVTIVISNTIGELVCSQSGKTNSAIQITIATPPGVYFLSAATEGEITIKKKVIIGY